MAVSQVKWNFWSEMHLIWNTQGSYSCFRVELKRFSSTWSLKKVFFLLLFIFIIILVEKRSSVFKDVIQNSSTFQTLKTLFEPWKLYNVQSSVNHTNNELEIFILINKIYFILSIFIIKPIRIFIINISTRSKPQKKSAKLKSEVFFFVVVFCFFLGPVELQ